MTWPICLKRAGQNFIFCLKNCSNNVGFFSWPLEPFDFTINITFRLLRILNICQCNVGRDIRHLCVNYTSNLHMWLHFVRLCQELERGGNLEALFPIVARVTEVAGSSNRLLRDHIKCIILSQREASWCMGPSLRISNLPGKSEMANWVGVGGEEEEKCVGRLFGRQEVPHLCMLQSERYSNKRTGQLNFSQRWTLILCTSFINLPCSVFTISKSSCPYKAVFPSSVLYVSWWNSICDYSRHGTFLQCRKYGEKWALYFEAFLFLPIIFPSPLYLCFLFTTSTSISSKLHCTKKLVTVYRGSFVECCHIGHERIWG